MKWGITLLAVREVSICCQTNSGFWCGWGQRPMDRANFGSLILTGAGSTWKTERAVDQQAVSGLAGAGRAWF